MKPAEILKHAPKVLTQAQRTQYFDDGYVLLPSFIPSDVLAELNEVTAHFIEESRQADQADKRFDVEPDHAPDNPRLRRLNNPVEEHDVYRKFALEGLMVDLAEDLVGPNVKYHHSKLNFKWSDGGEEVKWHQGHSVLAAQQLLAFDHRRLFGGRERRNGTDGHRAGQPQWRTV